MFDLATANWYETTPWIDFTKGSHANREEIFSKTHGLCGYCGVQEAVSLDHIVPTSRGGAKLNPDNLIGACLDCNNAKADMLLEEFRERYFVGRGGLFWFEKR